MGGTGGMASPCGTLEMVGLVKGDSAGGASLPRAGSCEAVLDDVGLGDAGAGDGAAGVALAVVGADGVGADGVGCDDADAASDGVAVAVGALGAGIGASAGGADDGAADGDSGADAAVGAGAEPVGVAFAVFSGEAGDVPAEVDGLAALADPFVVVDGAAAGGGTTTLLCAPAWRFSSRY